MNKRVALAQIPVELEFPDEMLGSIMEVLSGEYESYYSGENLTVLDIGANVGSFSIWANLRWPNSQFHAYEPHPDTYKLLVRNLSGLPNVKCHNTAVYPSEKGREPFWSRYAGDGESGLVAYMGRTFENLSQENVFEVPILHPRDLPRCDVIKADVEGAEALILGNMDLEHVSLILLEFQDDENKEAIKELLDKEFILEREDSFEWDTLLTKSGYKKDLTGNHFGRLFFTNKQANKLRKLDTRSLVTTRHADNSGGSLTLRNLLSALPGATKIALQKRLGRLL